MNKKTLFCVDDKCIKDPNLIGLKNEDLEKLEVYTNAEVVRDKVKESNGNIEVWVLSSNNIEAINLAATLKKDRPDIVVYLICFSFSGSLKSRANAANIDKILSIEAFKEHSRNLSKPDFVMPKTQKIDESKKAFLLSILSASGGSGKSSIAVIAAVLSQISGHKTLLVDADFQFGDSAYLLGINNPLTIDELILNRAAVAQLKPESGIPAVLAPPEKPELAEKVLEDFPAILENLRMSFDVVIVNTGSLWGEQQAVLLERSSKSLFVVDQRPTSINATKKVIDMCGRCGIPTSSILYIINKVSRDSLFSSVDVSCVLDGANVAEIMDGGVDVDESLANGKPIELLDARNPFIVSLWGLLDKLLPKAKKPLQIRKPKKKKKNFLFFNRKSA
ncbi:MAG: hypothetical protein Q4E88_04770 [Coriobacteriia bacterium]|nr:hypothetical protein [Coriobacteriia bacterium]